MATRDPSKKHTTPIFDNSAEGTPDPSVTKPVTKPVSNVVHALPDNQFDNVIRMVKNDPSHRNAVRHAAAAKLLELNIDRDESMEYVGTPEGSDQFDSGSIVDWIKRIDSEDADSIEQLLTIDATIEVTDPAPVKKSE